MARHENERIKQTLSKNHLCYVLITCDGPSEDGSMQVEMTYEGDQALASYLLEGAQNAIDKYPNEQCPPLHLHQKKIASH